MNEHPSDVADARNVGAAAQARPPRASGDVEPLIVVVTAVNCSVRMGGEASLPYHYFRLLRARGVEAYLVVHERSRDEIESAFAADLGRVYFLREDRIQRVLWRLGRRLPNRVYRATLGFVAMILAQIGQRTLIRTLVGGRTNSVVHQPYPVSPVEPSMIYDVGSPVVIGPMNGGMDFPPGFRDRESRLERILVRLGRRLRHAANRLLPGKLKAEILLVANPRSRAFLPGPLRGKVIELTENGVDLSFWSAPVPRTAPPDEPARFVFLGRLVDWKGADLLLEAWASVHAAIPASLELIGDGPMRGPLEAQRDRLGLTRTVDFAGYLPPEECARRLARADVLVLPSLIECGGSVVLEAMASGLPVIATGWGGPADYLDSSCGILLPSGSRDEFLAALSRAIVRLAISPELRQQMGAAARRRAEAFSWDAKIDRILEIYREAVRGRGSASPARGPDAAPAFGDPPPPLGAIGG